MTFCSYASTDRLVSSNWPPSLHENGQSIKTNTQFNKVEIWWVAFSKLQIAIFPRCKIFGRK